MNTQSSSEIPDNVLLQEILKKQIEAIKKQTTNAVENQRLQAIIQKQIDRSKNPNEFIAHENIQNYSNAIKAQTDSKIRLKVNDLFTVHSNIQKQLADLEMKLLPDFKKLSGEKQIHQIYSIILDLCHNIKEIKEKNRIEFHKMEKQLYDKQNEQKETIQKLEKQINRKQQQLSMLHTEISNEEIQMKEDKKQFLLKTRPKKQMLEKLERRHRLMQGSQP